jgi:acrylyl-CoA reductase (NADPH)/3-hydroxypropionyl-CoA dehydratase/3-hydroxypropionyl-CoA synthetase
VAAEAAISAAPVVEKAATVAAPTPTAPTPATPGEVRCDIARGVATLTLARPEARNALTIGMVEGLHAALDRIETDPTVRLVILRGEGEHLCAGADVKAFLAAVEAGAPEEADHFLAREYALDLRLARLPIPLVTIAHGVAMGGGLGLAFGGYVVATTRSRFAMPESRIGFLPDVGATFELKRRLGPPLARFLAWTGESFDGRQAIQWGFADVLVEPDRIDPLLEGLGRMARGEAAQRLNGSAEIAFLQARVAGGVPAFQGRWTLRSAPPSGAPELELIQRHFGQPAAPDVLRSLERAANSSDMPAEREWAAQTLALLKRRSPVSIWAADLLLRLDHETLAREASDAGGATAARVAAGSASPKPPGPGVAAPGAAGPDPPDWLSYLEEALEAASVEAGDLGAPGRPEPRALALALEFPFATAMLRHPDFAEGVAALREKRAPDFPSSREPLGIHRALMTERAGWTLLRHAARLARDPFWIDVARQELDWIGPPQTGYDGSAFPCERWFADGTLNASVEALDRWVERGRGGQAAFVWEGDRIDADRRPLEQRSITYADLLREVQRCAAALRALGLRRGDTLVLYMPNIIETYVVQLAAARIGVVYHPVFAGFAREELSDRLHLMGARVLVTVDGTFRKGEVVQYKRDFVDPTLRDFVPVDRALDVAAGILARHAADPGGAALARVRDVLADKVTTEKRKLLAILAREIEGGADVEGAPGGPEGAGGAGAAPEAQGGAVAATLEGLLLGDLAPAEAIGRAARLLDPEEGSHPEGTSAGGSFLSSAGCEALREIASRLEEIESPVEKVVVLRRIGTRDEAGWVEGRDIAYEEFLDAGAGARTGADGAPDGPAAAGVSGDRPEPMRAEDALFVMFTSGSTGKPKGLVHTHGGYLARLPFILRAVFGLTRDQRILTVADPGWITGQSFACWGPLAYGMTSVLPGFVPAEDRLWAAIGRYRVNFLKTGVTGIRAAMGDDPEHLRAHDLASLRHRGGEATLAEIQRAITDLGDRLPPGPAGDARRAGLARLSLCARAAYLSRWAGDPAAWPAIFEEAMRVESAGRMADAGVGESGREGGDGGGGRARAGRDDGGRRRPGGAVQGPTDEMLGALRQEAARIARAALADARRYTSCSCAEPLDAAVQAWWETHIGPMMNCWWRTEDSGPETGAAPTAHPQTADAAARPLPWSEIGIFVIRDDDGNRVPPRRAAIGEKGTVFVRANPGIARGTWARPEGPAVGAAAGPSGRERGSPAARSGGNAAAWKSDPRFGEIYHSDVPGWHNTGDAAVANPDGTLTFLGRDDEVLNVSGHRVGTQEIEGAVRGHPAVANVAAIGIPAEVRGDNPVLFVKLRAGHAPGGLLDNQLREAVAEAKGAHVAPAADFIFYVPALPTTKSGKILRRFLKYVAALDREALAGILARLRDPAARQGLLAADRETLAALFPELRRQGRTLRLGSVATVDRMAVLIDVLRAVAARRDLDADGAACPAGPAPAATAAGLDYQPYRAPAGGIYRLGRGDFRPGIDPLPAAQEAWAMRRDAFGRPQHGEPERALVKVIDAVPRDPEPNEVVVQNLFAGSTHNVLHALLADPVSPFEWHRWPYHVLGSGAVCRVVACGREVERQGLFVPGQLAVNFPATYRLLDSRVSEDAMHAGFEIQGFETPGGTLRPFDRLQATQILPVPKGLTLEQAASFMLNLVTVYRALTRRLGVRRGERLLVEGATGGTGAHAVDLGRLLGARITGIVSSPKRGRQVLEAGAEAYLDRTDPALKDLWTPVPDDPGEWEAWERAGAPLLAALRGRNDGRLAEAVISFSGRPAFGRLAQALAPGGRLAFFGAFGGYCLRFLGRGPEEGTATPGEMLDRAGLRAGMGVLVHYGAGAAEDPIGLEAIRAALERGARVVALTNTDAQGARLNRDERLASRMLGTVSLEALRRGSRFEWPDRMPDYDSDPGRYEHYENYTLKPLASAVGRLLRAPGEQRGQPDVVFARGAEDTLAADLFMVRPFTGTVVVSESIRRAYTMYAPQVWMRQRRILFPAFAILGSHMGNPQQGREVIDWIAQGLIAIRPPRVYAAGEAPRAFQAMHDNTASGAFVVHLTAPGRDLATEREIDEANGAEFRDDRYVTVRIDALRPADAGAADAGASGPPAEGRGTWDARGAHAARGTHVARVTLRGDAGRPPTLARDAIYQIGDAFRRLATDERLAAVILTGEGSVAFLAGQDLRQLYDEVEDAGAALAIARDAQRIFDAVEAFPRPVIAVVNGVALGGGHELLACAHYRLAVRSPRVRLGQPEIELGIIPGFAGTQRLTRMLVDRFGLERGVREALEMILSGRHYEAEEALALGLLDELLEANALQRAYALAAEHAAGLRDGDGPGATDRLAAARAARRAAREAWRLPLTLPADFLKGDERLRLLLRQALDPAVGRAAPAVRAVEATLAGLREGFEKGCEREARLFAALVVDERYGRRGIRGFLERREPPPLPPRRTVDLSGGGGL